MPIRIDYGENVSIKKREEDAMKNLHYQDITNSDAKVFNVATYFRTASDNLCEAENLMKQKERVFGFIEDNPHFKLDYRNVFEDAGSSGLTFDNRVGIQQMLKRADEGNFDILIVENIGRISRKMRMLFDMNARLIERGVGILAIDEELWLPSISLGEIFMKMLDKEMYKRGGMKNVY